MKLEDKASIVITNVPTIDEEDKNIQIPCLLLKHGNLDHSAIKAGFCGLHLSMSWKIH